MKRHENKTNRFFRIISEALVTLVVFTSIACNNIFSEKNVKIENGQKARLIITASAKTISREAVDPKLNLSDFSEFKFYASTNDLQTNLETLTPKATGKTLDELNEPAIELDAGLWNFALTASLGGVTFSGVNTKFEVSPDSINPISFTLTPDPNIDGGGLEIKLTFPTGANKVQIKLEPAAGGTAIFDEELTTSSTKYPIVTSGGKNSITFTRDIADPEERLAPGAYNLQYYFYDSDISDYLNNCEFIVNIAAGVTTRETELNISSLNDVYEITYDFKYYTYDGSASVVETITEEELLAQNASLVLPKKYFCKSDIKLPQLNNYSVSADSVMSFAGWYDTPNGRSRRIQKFPETDSDVSLYACFTDTIYVDMSDENALLNMPYGFSSVYPCYYLSHAINSIVELNILKTDNNADSNVDWKIIVDGQNKGATVSGIVGKSLTIQGKTGSTKDILDGERDDFAENPELIDTSAVLDISTGFPVTISKLKITQGGRGIAVSPSGSGTNKQTTLSLKSDTKIVNNIGADFAGGIYIYGNSAFPTILNIEDGVEISNNVSRGNDLFDSYGGGIGAENYGIINMSGGEICNNTVYDCGGGIYLGSNSTLNLTGGTISGNTASKKGGAIYKHSSASINLEGQTYIPYADNKNDIYLNSGTIILTGELDYSNAADSNQVYGITVPTPTTITQVLTDNSNGKLVSGFCEYFVTTVAGYEISSDGEWTAKTDTAYAVYHYQQPVNGSKELDDYVLTDTDKKTGTTGTTTEASEKSYTGFTVQAFEQDVIAGDGSTEIKIYYDRNSITYTFNKATGENWTSTSETGTRQGLYEASFTPPTITKAGYTFTKWLTASDEELVSPYTFDATNKNYTATWQIIQYEINYQLDGGTNDKDNPSIYTIESVITLKEPSKEDAVFDGWYTDSYFTTSITQIPEGTYQTGETPLTLYAKWKYNTGLDINIDTGEGSKLTMAVTVDGTNFDASNNMITAGYGINTAKTIVFTPDLSGVMLICKWYIDGTELTSPAVDENNKLTINTLNMLPGIYDIQFKAYKTYPDKMYESYYTQLEIKSLGTKLKPTAVGDIVFNDGSAISYSSDLTLTDEQKDAAISIIFYKGKELNDGSNTKTRLLGVGLETNSNGQITTLESNDHLAIIASELSDTATEHSYPVTYSGAEKYFTGLFNGSENWRTLCDSDSTIETNAETEYPAFYWANTYGTTHGLNGSNLDTGWYLPSVVELLTLYNQLSDINNIITTLGKTEFPHNSTNYYVSSCAKNKSFQYAVYFYNGTLSGMNNTLSTLTLSAIREF